MSFLIRVEPTGHKFTTEAGETILDAAERNGINLPYGCRNGVCGSCAGNLVSGNVRYPNEIESAREGKPENQVLTCQAFPTSDLVLQIHEVEASDEIVPRTLPCKVERMERLADDVMRIWLRLPEGERLQFLAGQYLDFLLPDGRRRAFSIANAPHDDELIELHIRHVPGGEFTDKVFSEMEVGDIQRIEAPMGGFYLREESGRPLIMMAGGTGFAPLKAIIEHAFHIGLEQPIQLYWGARTEADIYLPDLPRQWAEQHPRVTFTPVLSEADDDWQGRRGWVHEAVLKDNPDMSAYDLYMSGPPPMVFAGKRAFMAAGLAEEHIYSDVFEWAKDNPDKG